MTLDHPHRTRTGHFDGPPPTPYPSMSPAVRGRVDRDRRFRTARSWGGSLLLLLAAGTVGAQPAASASAIRPDPLDASSTVPPAVHRSALGEHRTYRPSEVGSWSEANDTVNRIGGWRAYAREAEGGAGGAAAPAAAGTPAAATPSGAPAHRHR